MESTDNQRSALRTLSLGDLDNIPPRPRRGINCINIGNEAVTVRGEALHEVWWRGEQWAVTAYGIERLDGTYVAEASRLTERPEHSWPMHMAEKIWVDIDEFTTAWMVALLLHGILSPSGKCSASFARAGSGRKTPMTEDFNWGALDKTVKVVNEARETAVYLNHDGDVLIRQRADWPNEQDDPALVIPLYRVRALIDRLDALLLEAHTESGPSA